MTTYTTLISAPDLQSLIASGAPLMVFAMLAAYLAGRRWWPPRRPWR